MSNPGGTARRQKSKFTYKHLSQLSLSSTSSPLRVVAHIDLDAFYAQCEMVRLGVPEDKPLAVQQWQGLIAINYPARDFGLNRHITITEAKKLCPELIMQHVATWREGDERWAYHDDAFEHIATHKVSLDPYRLQSRRILATIKDALPAAPLQKVEKASIDEVFLDLSAQVHSLLLARYPELDGPPPYDDMSESLPLPPTTALDWNTDALIDLDTTETEDDDPDWDDIAMLIGSEIIRSVRATIRQELHYTCSAGIAQNKMLAKLGSAHKKPNQQTIVRNRAVQQFLSSFKFTKIRNLGGKLGDQVVSTFETETVRDLLEVPLDQLKLKLGDDTGSWIFQIIRGIDNSEVNSRTQIKSMLSAKSFRPSINTSEQAMRWLRIFVADIYTRLVEEGVLENKRRPRTVNLHHRQGGQTRSRQAPIPQGRSIDEMVLLDLSKNLLNQVIAEGKAWPCANLSLSVGGFEDGITGNQGIGAFLVKGEEAKAMVSSVSKGSIGGNPATSNGPPEKRRKTDDGGIGRFLTKRESSREEHDEEFGAEDMSGEDSGQATGTVTAPERDEARTEGPLHLEAKEAGGVSFNAKPQACHVSDPLWQCADCNKSMELREKEEHRDWHFAKSLQAEDRSTTSRDPPRPIAAGAARRRKSRPVGRESRSASKPLASGDVASTFSAKVEKGQSRLAFGP
ncbi:MAG: DNA-directed DNA polymerase eta rad30 [Caeruleum heppii]|nr:MAG: DNA-directed DNA polymerase eta rad30 [Caeruleum heppii]